MNEFGGQIGEKFDTDGTPRRYPGNTVISDIPAGSPAHGALLRVQKSFSGESLSGLFIFLPGDSFHMTVIRGLNDLVRTDGYWPPALDRSAPLSAADRHVSLAVASVPGPGPFRMRFHRVEIGREDLRVLLLPEDESALQRLRSYRDRVADVIGLRLPGHDGYGFHVTLAYVWRKPDAFRESLLEEVRARSDALLSGQPPFDLGRPRMAYYEDMTRFSDARQEEE